VARQEKQDIDVRGGIEFAASVAADREQGQRAGKSSDLPQVAEHFVDQPAALAQQARRIALAR
jgi:hypothetical protein